jgi:hypothetical protein
MIFSIKLLAEAASSKKYRNVYLDQILRIHLEAKTVQLLKKRIVDNLDK